MSRRGSGLHRLCPPLGANRRQIASREAVLQGFGNAGVLEIVDDFDGSTYRAVYTVRFAQAVYALHVFQKKSHKGIATPKQDIELVKARLKRAETHYAALVAETQGKMQ